MHALKRVGQKVEAGIQKMDKSDPVIECHSCNKLMANQTKSPYNWSCMYCKKNHLGKDKFYRLSCFDCGLDVCKPCAKEIHKTDQLYKKFPTVCGLCTHNLQDATRAQQNWTCNKCDGDFVHDKIKGRYHCPNHNLNYCRKCMKKEVNHFIGLEAKKRAEFKKEQIKEHHLHDDKAIHGYEQRFPSHTDTGVYQVFPNKKFSDMLRSKEYALVDNKHQQPFTQNQNSNQHGFQQPNPQVNQGQPPMNDAYYQQQHQHQQPLH